MLTQRRLDRVHDVTGRIAELFDQLLRFSAGWNLPHGQLISSDRSSARATIELSYVYFTGHVHDNKFSAAPACTPDWPSIAIASLFVLIAASARARRLASTRHPFMFASGYNGDDLHDAYRDVAVLQELYDIAEFKAVLAISLMEEDG